MRRAQVIGLSIAVGAGLLAFVGMRSALRPAPVPVIHTEQVDAVQVLVARTDIPLGQITNDGSFRWQDWPRENLNQMFVTRSSRPDGVREFSGSIARSSLAAGEPITETKLVKPGAGGVLAAILPAGMRAISTKITEQSAVGKLILPNDHVDVILAQRKRNSADGQEEIFSTTVLRNVRVLAIGQQIEAKDGKKNAEGNVATLELEPAQAERLAWANTVGEISLALMSIADLNNQGPSLGDEPKLASKKREHAGEPKLVDLHKGTKRETYSCTPHCYPATVAPGDSSDRPTAPKGSGATRDD